MGGAPRHPSWHSASLSHFLGVPWGPRDELTKAKPQRAPGLMQDTGQGLRPTVRGSRLVLQDQLLQRGSKGTWGCVQAGAWSMEGELQVGAGVWEAGLQVCGKHLFQYPFQKTTRKILSHGGNCF